MHADQREANTTDVDIVNLGVDEDVVDVQLDVVDLLSGVDDRARRESRGLGDPLDGVSHGQGSLGTLGAASGDLLLDGEAEEEVAGSDEQAVGLLLNLDLDETLAVGDRHGGDREARILVEPEDA